MKMSKWFILIFGALCSFLQGCVMPKNPDLPGFAEGYNAAVTYMVSEPVQPEEVNLAIRSGYRVLKALYTDGADPTDLIVRKYIGEMYGEKTPEFQEMIFNFYSLSKANLIKRVDMADSPIPKRKIITNFINGVEQALKEAQYKRKE